MSPLTGACVPDPSISEFNLMFQASTPASWLRQLPRRLTGIEAGRTYKLSGMSTADPLATLQAAYAAMEQLDDMTPQRRGQHFNGWIANLLRANGIRAKENLRSNGEIDVVFSIGDTRYILEAKWQRPKADTGHLAKLQKRVRQRLSGTYGVFVSMEGYTPEALHDLMQGDRLELILLDKEHIEAVLAREISPVDLLAALRDQAAFAGRPYTPMAAVRDAYRGQAADGPAVSLAGLAAGLPPSHGNPPQPGWDPQQARRGNPANEYTTFNGYQGLYWVVVAIMLLLAFITTFGVIDGHGLWKIVAAVGVVFELLLVVNSWRLAMRPVRLEIGTAGIQAFFPKRAAWLPWDQIDRVDIVRIDGSLAVVAWTNKARVFPTSGESGLGAFYIPSMEAVAVCSLGPLRAKRHDVARALQVYGMNRF